MSRKASLTYAEAQMRIDDTTMNDDITKSLRGLNKLAKILKGRRIDKGYFLLIRSVILKFCCDSEAVFNPLRSQFVRVAYFTIFQSADPLIS